MQMHFQRGQQPNAGNGPTGFGTDAQGNAPGDERSGTWVRVGGPAAGANWGALYTPRIDSEVNLEKEGAAAAAHAKPAKPAPPEEHPKVTDHAVLAVDEGAANAPTRTTKPTRKVFQKVTRTIQGIVGEHIADYHCIEGTSRVECLATAPPARAASLSSRVPRCAPFG